MKFKTKLYLGFGFLILLFIILQITLILMMNQLNQNMNNSARNYRMAELANTIRVEYNIFSRETSGFATLTNPPAELINKFKENKEKSFKRAKMALEQLSKLDKRKKSQELFQQLEEETKALEEMDVKSDQLLKEGKIQEVYQLYWYDSREVREMMIKTADELKKIQDQTLEKELQRSRYTYDLAIKMVYVYVIAGLLFGIGFTIWILRTTTGNLNKVTSVMTKVAFNRSDQLPRIKVKSKDEIGAIAIAFNEMAQALEEHTKQEKELKQAAEEQSWLNTKIAEIATMYPGINNLEELAQLFITKLTPMVGANYGVLYMKSKKDEVERFQKLGSYAYNDRQIGAQSFRLGEGIVGQCAFENRVILLEQIPENYIKITSGVGEGSPNSILVIPAEYQGEVLAVIELASFKPFTRLEKELLEKVISNLGININSILRHMEVERLLQESQTLTEELQSQSEELQLQQEELRTVNEQLEEQFKNLESKTVELEKIKNMLEEKAQQLALSSQYKSEFLANMSHELRTPLNSLLILAQLLSENGGRNLTSKQVEYAKTIFTSGQDLLRLINDILDISKIEAGKMEIFAEETDISEIKRFVESQFTPLARQKALEFSVLLDSDLPEAILTDQQRLQQILINLLSNAFKFTEKGSVSLQIRKSMQTVFSEEHGTNKVASFIAFSVKDTGIGISQENQNMIFEAFKQADGTTSRKYGGTGLGLSICRELAQLLNGFIVVDSTFGEGSTFTLYIPAGTVQFPLSRLEAAVTVETEEQLVEETHDDSGETTSLAGKKVLVVDDDMRNIFALTTALESYAVEVVFAENGKEGIEVLQNNPDIDMILMDIMMPEMDGFEAMRWIRRIPEFSNLPIIALTAKAMKNDRKKCIEAGASDYISKPVNMEQLISIMRVWLYQ